MDNLVLIIDNSFSMDQSISNNGGLTRLELVKRQLDDLLQTNNIYESVSVFTFEHTADLLGSYQNLNEARKSISQITCKPIGKTEIEHTLSQVIEQVMFIKSTDQKDSHFTIICLTDGEDQSLYEREMIIGLYSNLENMFLKIILINDLQKDIVDKPANNTTLEIQQIQDLNNLKNSIMKASDVITKKTKPLNNVAIPVFPLVECEPNDLEKMRDELLTIVPYLENLTSLRYYPVPTFIVNRFLLEEVGIFSKELKDDDSDLLSNLSELMEYTSAVELTYHTRKFDYKNLKFGGDDSPIEAYGLFINREEEYRQWVRCNAEATSSWLHSFIYGKELDYPEPYPNDKNKIRNTTECVSSIKEIQYTIKSVLQKLNKSEDNIVKIDQGYFDDPKWFINQKRFEKNAICRITPDLKKWEKLLDDSDYKKVLNYVDHEGRWKLDIESIFTVYSIALETIYRLLPKARALSSVNSQVIKNRETYGVYLPPESGTYSKLNKILNTQKFPLFFNIDQSGVVLICIEDCKKDCGEIENNDLWPDFLSSILVHEHTHAITRQGVAKMEKDNFIEWQGDPQKSKIVNEALAEWAELNYCRDRKSLYQVTIEHAASGQLPEWPYAGALALEMEFQKKGEGFFKRLLKMYRSGNEKSYDRFF